METHPTSAETEDRLPWHKPELQRLVISLDTRLLFGSGADGGYAEPVFE